MTASNAIATVGSQILKSSEALAASGYRAFTYTKIGDVEAVNDVSIKTATADATILDGDGWDANKPLNHSMPPLNVDMNYVPTDATQQGCLADQIARTKRWFKVLLPSGDSFYIPGYVTETTVNIKTKSLLKGKFEITPDGAPDLDDLTS